MPKKIGNSSRDRHNARAAEFTRNQRVVGSEGAGSGGDIRDRFRDVYQPGAHPPPKPGLMSPAETIKRIGAAIKRRPRVQTPKPS